MSSIRSLNTPEQQTRKDITGVGPEIARMLARPDTFLATTIFSLGVMALVPGMWLGAVPASLAHGYWIASRRFRLPFRVPAGWGGPDYSTPDPGQGRKAKTGQGILYLGNDMSTNEELWVTNSDARRHAFVLGTTGAGKSLPHDALVLTTNGWVLNRDLKPGVKLIHPSGKVSTVVSVHPQGPLPVVRFHFADGRMAECSRDHLWSVNTLSTGLDRSIGETGFELRTASDIGIQVGMDAVRGLDSRALRMFTPFCSPVPGFIDGSALNRRSIRLSVAPWHR